MSHLFNLMKTYNEAYCLKSKQDMTCSWLYASSRRLLTTVGPFVSLFMCSPRLVFVLIL